MANWLLDSRKLMSGAEVSVNHMVLGLTSQDLAQPVRSSRSVELAFVAAEVEVAGDASRRSRMVDTCFVVWKAVVVEEDRELSLVGIGGYWRLAAGDWDCMPGTEVARLHSAVVFFVAVEVVIEVAVILYRTDMVAVHLTLGMEGVVEYLPALGSAAVLVELATVVAEVVEVEGRTLVLAVGLALFQMDYNILLLPSCVSLSNCLASCQSVCCVSKSVLEVRNEICEVTQAVLIPKPRE